MIGETPAQSSSDFPRQHARTRRFSLGVPRGIVAGRGPDGPMVLFLRSDTGDDPTTHLWRHDPRSNTTEKLVDAHALVVDDAQLPAEERARRERAREQATGIVSYAVDRHLQLAVFSINGRLFSVTVDTGVLVAHPSAGPVFDPRPAPDAHAIAYHAVGGLHLVELVDGFEQPGRTRALVTEPDAPAVGWGRAEFVAAEEMGRQRGFWWSGDGRAIAVARVDETRVASWTIADPARPWEPAVTHRYPAAGTQNADVTLWVVDVESQRRTEVVWDRSRDEYLARVRWGDDPLTLLVQPRDQRAARVLTADPADGRTTPVHTWRDDAWVELIPGTPAWLAGRLLTIEDRMELGPWGTRALCLDGVPVTPAGLQLRELLDATTGDADDHRVTFMASPADDPTRIDSYVVAFDGTKPAPPVRVAAGEAGPGVSHLLVGRREPTVSGVAVPDVLVDRSRDKAAPRVTVLWGDGDVGGDAGQPLEVLAQIPPLTAQPRWLTLGDDGLRAALFLPQDGTTAPLPVLLDPYGGPHAQRVLAIQSAHLTSQWLANQGFAVLVADGRGTPGRGPRWERAVRGDLATPVLEDQVRALHAAAAIEPRLDLGSVGIRGWSFGGYLAALAVLRRPDVFHAAVAGAPVTDWRLYDTHYTERYLGHPDREPEAYAVSSLIDAEGRLGPAASWPRDHPPALLLIHGLADDNVVAAHTLRLSAALLADGRAHEVLPLSGVTHMTPQETIAQRLLDHEVAFLRRALRPR